MSRSWTCAQDTFVEALCLEAKRLRFLLGSLSFPVAQCFLFSKENLGKLLHVMQPVFPVNVLGAEIF